MLLEIIELLTVNKFICLLGAELLPFIIVANFGSGDIESNIDTRATARAIVGSR